MSDSPPEPDPLERLLKSIDLLMAAGRYREALPLIGEAMVAAPTDSRPRCWNALALNQLGRRQEALRQADEAVACAPENEWAHRIRSSLLWDLGRSGAALEAARTAVRLDPEGELTLQSLAFCLLNTGRWDEARQAAERLREAAPESGNAYYILGFVALQRRKWKDAESLCRRALELDPQDYYAMHDLGRALQGQRRKREALECFRLALQINPNFERSREEIRHTITTDLSNLPIWMRAERLAEEHPDIQAYIRTEQERERRGEVRFYVVVGLIIAGVVGIAIGSFALLVVAYMIRGSELRYPWEWAIYYTLLGIASAVYLVLLVLAGKALW